jgi:hypothetical protein
VVHNRSDISSVEKFTYLKVALHGKASALIASVPFGEAHYDSAWRELCEHYNNPRILGFDYLDKILEFPISPAGSLSSMQSFVNTFSEIHAALGTLNIPNLGEFILFRIAARVTDTETLSLFEETLHNEPFPSVIQLLSFVKRRIKVLQTSFGPNVKDSISRRKSTLTSAKVVLPISVDNTPPGKEKGDPVSTCPLCGLSHFILKCSKYAMSVRDRAGFVRSKRLCFNCLKPGHRAPRCQQKGMCYNVSLAVMCSVAHGNEMKF